MVLSVKPSVTTGSLFLCILPPINITCYYRRLKESSGPPLPWYYDDGVLCIQKISHPLQHLLHKAVISICISTMNNDINHLFIFVDCLNILYEEPVQILCPCFLLNYLWFYWFIAALCTYCRYECSLVPDIFFLQTKHNFILYD